jgi:redox-sensitive bicupin YhaK (pirin superfamily)
MKDEVSRREVLKGAAASAAAAMFPGGTSAPGVPPRLTIRRASERGHVDHGWLDTFHTFSFADYYDPAHMGFRALRVINEDRVAPAQGFPAHPHRDMEILTYVLEGSLRHQDTMGHGSVIRPGEVQKMTAGTGVLHSEANASREEPVHLLQIWLLPPRHGYTPTYEQKPFALAERPDRLVPLGTRDGRDGSLRLRADADLHGAVLRTGATVRHDVVPGRAAWVQVARGEVVVNGTKLSAGDGASTEDAGTLEIRAAAPSEVLVFDL